MHSVEDSGRLRLRILKRRTLPIAPERVIRTSSRAPARRCTRRSLRVNDARPRPTIARSRRSEFGQPRRVPPVQRSSTRCAARHLPHAHPREAGVVALAHGVVPRDRRGDARERVGEPAAVLIDAVAAPLGRAGADRRVRVVAVDRPQHAVRVAVEVDRVAARGSATLRSIPAARRPVCVFQIGRRAHCCDGLRWPVRTRRGSAFQGVPYSSTCP